jgi:hypothetical protein
MQMLGALAIILVKDVEVAAVVSAKPSINKHGLLEMDLLACADDDDDDEGDTKDANLVVIRNPPSDEKGQTVQIREPVKVDDLNEESFYKYLWAQW